MHEQASSSTGGHGNRASDGWGAHGRITLRGGGGGGDGSSNGDGGGGRSGGYGVGSASEGFASSSRSNDDDNDDDGASSLNDAFRSVSSSGYYSDDSAVCVAAAHAGVLLPHEYSMVVATVRRGVLDRTEANCGGGKGFHNITATPLPGCPGRTLRRNSDYDRNYNNNHLEGGSSANTQVSDYQFGGSAQFSDYGFGGSARLFSVRAYPKSVVQVQSVAGRPGALKQVRT